MDAYLVLETEPGGTTTYVRRAGGGEDEAPSPGARALRPGEWWMGIPYSVWSERAGRSVDVPALQRELGRPVARPSRFAGIVGWVKALTLFEALSLFGLVLVWVQVKGAGDALHSTAFQGLSTQQTEINKVLLERPHLRPYFFDGKPLVAGDPLFPEVQGAVDMHLDFFDSYFTQSRFIGHLENDADTQVAWEEYIRKTARSSPVMCARLHQGKHAYTRAFVDVFLAACPAAPRA